MKIITNELLLPIALLDLSTNCQNRSCKRLKKLDLGYEKKLRYTNMVQNMAERPNRLLFFN